ncbi:hypothetical protein PEC18_03440 [Paucibacter sp. O1-1]|nr:hypothetical protein [Paucibacter sp. O1-1]MDA3824931.1 hypothetical protein [Paucibacter sp. O1-1]
MLLITGRTPSTAPPRPLALTSELKFRLPLRQKLLAGVSAAGASRYVDVVNKRVCDVRGNVAFALTQDAVAKVTYQRLGAGGGRWATRWT